MADNEIIYNFVYLSDHISNLTVVLNHLLQDETISINEMQQIESERTDLEKNGKLLTVIQRKDWLRVRDRFLEILRKTNNAHCAEEIEKEKERKVYKDSDIRKCEKIGKWWPNKKPLIAALHERLYGDKLLVEELHDRITENKNRMAVICESPDAGKYSGMGGVGKTLTATWYAYHYEAFWFYEHILWIDCGEESLLTSFKNLARDLKVEDRNELTEVKEFARKCFEILSPFKCLWIYDNAEKYKGKDGLIHVLPNPNEQKKFYCLITSRNREWGSQTGYGTISDLQLEVFSPAESFEFLQANLKKEIKCTEYEFKELCRLLGNLPLALQLAVAALNSSEMDVKTYIGKSKFVKVLDAEFDDYEKTINGNVKVSLDLIEKEKEGTTALAILMIFGYIRPDDIEVEFFKSTLQIQDDRKLKESLKLLTKYSLVAKTKIMKFRNEKEIYFSIHRLLQQVIRHNAKETEKEILRKVLSCDGFIDHKLLAFTKYADQELRKEFPKVKAQLMEQHKLRKLIWQKRLEESIQLGKFIDQELKRNTTKLNYAICLHENGQLEESVRTAEELLHVMPLTVQENNISKALDRMVEYLKTINLRLHVERKIFLMDFENNDELRNKVADLLLFSYLRQGRFDEAVAIGRRTASQQQIWTILTQVMRENKFDGCVQLAKLIHQEMNTNTTKLNYAICLDKNGELERCANTLEELYQQVAEDIKYEDDSSLRPKGDTLSPGGIPAASRGPEWKGMVGGHLLLAYFKSNDKEKGKELQGNRKTFKIIYSQENLGILIRLVHSDFIHGNYFLHSNSLFSHLNLEVESKIVQLIYCCLPLNSLDRLCPQELYLDRVSFVLDGEELQQFKVNDFVDLVSIKRLALSCHYTNKNVTIDLSGDVSMEYLHLNDVQVFNWNDCNWNVIQLQLINIPFEEKTNLQVQDINFYSSLCDVSCLPQTLQRLTLNGTEVLVSEQAQLPNLNYLTLEEMGDVDCLDCLPHFRSAPQLTHIHLNGVREVNVDFLVLLTPLTHLIISKSYFNTRVVGGLRKLEKLILGGFALQQVEECLTYFQTDNVVIHSDPIQPKQLARLMNKQINTIVVGVIKWDKEDFYNYSSRLDTQADYYFLQGGRGWAMDKNYYDSYYYQ